MKHLLIVLCMMACIPMWAGVIKGKVVDDKKAPLEFVNVAVYQDGNTAPVKGTVSDEVGQFEIDGIKDGSYVVKFSFMGYGEQQRNVTLNAGNQHTANLKTVTLAEDQAMLQEVSVSTQKSAMRLDIDKKVFDVSQSITTAGLSASEALENIPSVEVDQEGKISLRGSESVTVWINGKAQGLTSDNRGDILQQMPAESIERIEVITNPSSKYSPEGSAGIINIVLKRDRKAGYYGGVQLNLGKSKDLDPDGRLGANINYSSGVLEAYANVGLGRRVRSNHSTSYRDYYCTEHDDYNYGYMSNSSEGGGKGTNLFGRAGLTWHATQKDAIGIGYMGMFGLGNSSRYTDSNFDQNFYSSEARNLYNQRHPNATFEPYTQHTYSESGDKPQMTNVELSYRHEWSSNHTFEAEFSYGKWMGDNDSWQSDETKYEDRENLITYWQEGKMGNEDYELQMDYAQPLGETGKFEAGYKGNWSRENSPQETWEDKEKSTSYYWLFNRFIYNQDTHAAYANYQNRIGKLGYQLGLRGEYWTVDTESYNYDQEYGTNNLSGQEIVPKYKKTFFKIFPTVFLNYELPAGQELQVNYTRRLRRPWGGQLNSFKNIRNPKNISFGNPELTATYTNSFELNYIKTWDEHTLSVSTYYRPSSDVMQRISFIDGDVMYSTSENLTKEQSSGIELIGKNKLFRIINLTTTVNTYYYQLDGGTFEVQSLGKTHVVNVAGSDDFSWNASMMAQVTLPWQLAFQATGRYTAAKVIAQGKRDASYSLDMGLRRAFFDRKLTVNLNVRNALDSRKFKSHTNGRGYAAVSEGVWGSRRFGIQLSYSFGNMNSGKPRRSQGQRSMEGGDEESGMGGGMDAGGGFDM